MTTSLGASGCWLQPRYDAGRTNRDPGERVLTTATVGDLRVLWQGDTQTGTTVTDFVATGNAIYAGTRGGPSGGVVARLDRATGAAVWRRTIDPGVAPTPPDVSNLVFADGWLRVSWSCCRSGVAGTYWLHPADGSDGGGPPEPSGGWIDPAVADGRLAGIDVSPPSFYVLSWGDVSLVASSDERGSPAGRFAIVGDTIQWANGTRAQGFGPACRPSAPAPDCALAWEDDLGARPGPPAAVGTDAVAWPDESGAVTVVDARTGDRRWRAELGEPIVAAPVVTDATVVVRTATRVVGLAAGGCGAAECAPAWAAPVADGRTLVGGGDVAYATTTTGDVVALAADGCGAATCAPLATVQVGGDLAAEPIVHAGQVVVGDRAGLVTALGLPA